jgi:hypothetical protein
MSRQPAYLQLARINLVDVTPYWLNAEEARERWVPGLLDEQGKQKLQQLIVGHPFKPKQHMAKKPWYCLLGLGQA